MELKNKAPNPVDVLADETGKGALQSDQFPKRIDRYSRAKAKALAISNYIHLNHPDQHKLSAAVSQCGSYLEFAHYYKVDEIRLSRASFCKKHLLCPLCAIRRGSKLLGRYLDRFEELKAANDRVKPYMVTFTVKDGPDLLERFTRLQKGLQEFHKRRHRKGRYSESQKASGAVWSYEVKRGKNSKLWHPHAHAVWLCEEPPSQAAISAEWEQITKDSFIVDVRPITPEDPIKGFLEVFKYAVKFSDQDDADTWHCYETLRGRRLIASFGDFYGIPEPDELTDDPLEGQPFHRLFYQFIGSAYRKTPPPV